MEPAKSPRVFISYSWESEDHKSWVRHLGERLYEAGIEARLDQWFVQPGESFTAFMEQEVAAADFVLVVCTPLYAHKSNNRQGGVGYEQQIVSGQLMSGTARSKFIPILRAGDYVQGPDCAIPTHFLGIAWIDFRNDVTFDKSLEDLIRVIFSKPRFAPPPLGARPSFETITATRPNRDRLAFSALTSTDEEFELFTEQLLTGSNEPHLNIIVEKLRDKTVEVWKTDLDEHTLLSAEEILRIKESDFIPAIQRLTLLGLLLVKFSAPQEWFSKVANLLIEIFDMSHYLAKKVESFQQHHSVDSLAEQANHTVPVIESLLCAYVLAGYELSRNSNVYMSLLFSRIVEHASDPIDVYPAIKWFYLFWPMERARWGSPKMSRHQMVIERYGNADRIAKLLGGKTGMESAMLQVDCLIEWHSYLSFDEQGPPEIVRYFRERYPNVSTIYYPDFFQEDFSHITPLMNKLWAAVRSGGGEMNDWFVLPGLVDAFREVEIERRQHLLGKFLLYISREQSRTMLANNRMPYRVHWPPEIAALVNRVRENEEAKR